MDKTFPTYGCHVDLFDAPNEEPDDCVLNMGEPQSCIYAARRKVPHTCEYWRKVQPKDQSHV